MVLKNMAQKGSPLHALLDAVDDLLTSRFCEAAQFGECTGCSICTLQKARLDYSMPHPKTFRTRNKKKTKVRT